MMPELDQPFGRRRWDPLADIEALVTKDATPATGLSEDLPGTPAQTPDAR